MESIILNTSEASFLQEVGCMKEAVTLANGMVECHQVPHHRGFLDDQSVHFE